jgi:sugar phosphate permease
VGASCAEQRGTAPCAPQVGSVAKAYGWRWGMWAPGLIGAAMALLVGAAVADSPQAAGYPAVEQPAAQAQPKVCRDALRLCLWLGLEAGRRMALPDDVAREKARGS